MNLKQGYSKEATGARKRFCQFLQLNWEAFVSKFQISGEGLRSEEKWQLME